MEHSDFLSRIQALPVVDTHEHWPDVRFMEGRPLEFFDLLVPYVCDILLAAGMPRDEYALLFRRELPFGDRWAVFAPWLPEIRHTTYFQAILRTLRDTAGLAGPLDAASAEAAGRCLSEANGPGAVARILREENVVAVMTFLPFDGVPSIVAPHFHAVPTVSDIHIRNRLDLERFGRALGREIADFDGLLEAIRALFRSYREAGVRAVKFGAAYRRTLDYAPVSRSEAERRFLEITEQPVMGDTRSIGAPTGAYPDSFTKPLDDYLVDFMVGLAGEMGVPAIFHVGLHAWNENRIEAVQGRHLEPLVRRHRNVRFVLLHAGMPFIDDAVLLARYFPNVVLNLTWAHIIDRARCRELIRCCVETLAVSKVQGFGGDYMHPQQLHGHLAFARENLAVVLQDLVREGVMDDEEALDLARRWLLDNPVRYFGL